MSNAIDWIDQTLGRLIFRALGLLCAIVVLVCAYAIWRFVSDWDAQSLVPVVMFAVAGLAAAIAVPHCFSSRRRFVEVLDAMEDESPHLRQPATRKRPPEARG